MIEIQAEDAVHHASVRSLHLAAFPTPAEADLVDRLRRDEDAAISLVAVHSGFVVGHAMFSPMRAPFRALGLGPIAVATAARRQGIAAGLIRTGLTAAKASGWEAVFVLGEPAYYSRFGFSAADAEPFESVYAGPYLMALALRESGLPMRSGRIDYAPAFSAIG